MISKKELIIGERYWIRLPQFMPNGELRNVFLESVSALTVSVDVAVENNPYRNIQTFQFNTVHFIERIL